jgi:hypothetical protein
MPEQESIRVAVKIRKELDRSIEIEAAKRGVTKSQIFEEALSAFIKKAERRTESAA